MVPVLALIGKPNCGKTTLVEKLIPVLAAKGLRVGTIKHHHGEIQMDTPGKDTWRHKQAGAHLVILSSPSGIGLIQDTDEEIPVAELMSRYCSDVDLVIAEGYKKSTLPKIEVFSSALYDTPLDDPGENLIALVSDQEVRPDLPWFRPDDVEGLAGFINEKIITPGR
jgi:molybdopterin-guanine dinucleotide biosynthesis protein B